MPARLLRIAKLKDSPFATEVGKQITDGLAPLVDSKDLVIDLTGKASGKPDYELEFDTSPYGWNPGSKTGCWFHPSSLGVTGTVTLDALKRRNYCLNSDQCKTCEAVFRNTAAELGRAIGDTALHEIGHLFGLMDEHSFAGANADGHTGDPRNPMFADLLHKDYVPLPSDSKRTTKYTIVAGDTLSVIARRVGLFQDPPVGGAAGLLEFKGQDGRRNRELLRSSADKIDVGEQIWIPDLSERLKFMRAINLDPKAFTPVQFDRMRAWIQAGRSID